MKILFSPSESKSTINSYKKIDKNSFILPELFEKRVKVLKIYQKYINKSDISSFKKLIGIKNDKIVLQYKKIDVFNSKTQKAVLRYNGVGYEYLDYKSLNDDQKVFIDNNMIIFSNLFGPIKAGDKIPFYKLKQGEKIGDLCCEKYYKDHFSTAMEGILDDELILDLRAAFYEKMYTPSKKYITFKFLKNSRSLSHWAKAYRGKVAKELSIYRPKNEEELMNIEFSNLKIKEIKENKNKKEFIFEII